MKVSECIPNCEFLLREKYPSGAFRYGCLSEKAPKKTGPGPFVSDYNIFSLKSCPEGFVSVNVFRPKSVYHTGYIVEHTVVSTRIQFYKNRGIDKCANLSCGIQLKAGDRVVSVRRPRFRVYCKKCAEELNII